MRRLSGTSCSRRTPCTQELVVFLGHRREEASTGDATKPPTPRLATVEAAEQAPARHEAADAVAGRGGGGGASPRT
jgi:hypothetical protein